jgi:hypothetical protein
MGHNVHDIQNKVVTYNIEIKLSNSSLFLVWFEFMIKFWNKMVNQHIFENSYMLNNGWNIKCDVLGKF